MKTLVYAEHDNASLKDATLAVVTAASQLGEVQSLLLAQAAARLLMRLPRSLASAPCTSPMTLRTHSSLPKMSHHWLHH